MSPSAVAIAGNQRVNVESWTYRHLVHDGKPGSMAQNRLSTESSAWCMVQTFTSSTTAAAPHKGTAKPVHQAKHEQHGSIGGSLAAAVC